MNKNEKITYKKITYKNRHELTPELLKEIFKIDPFVDNTNEMEFNRYAQLWEKNINNKITPYIIYLVYVGNELAASANGHMFIEKMGNNINKEFVVDHLFVKIKYRKKGIGLKLKIRLISDLRAKYNVEKIHGNALEEMQKINEKIVGKRPLTNKPGEKTRTQKSKYVKYDLKNTAKLRADLQGYTITIFSRKMHNRK
ncbi:MAG TPA: hypothetical protein PKK56_02570 [archaeon]|nr:hypothetical protein [archaeon]